MATAITYKRGQVEWALWRSFNFLRSGPEEPPQVFLTRIKRLLELDREGESYEESEVPHSLYAFFDESPEGQGRDASYTPFNAFCLALGLDMLDAGFKQSEIVFLLRHIREELEEQFADILKCPPEPRQRIFAKHRPDCPSYEENGRQFADCRVFAVINKLEIKEIFPGLKGRLQGSQPLFLQPVFCRGIKGLQEELHKMNYNYRKALILELAHTAALVTEFLDEAPLVKRGRK